MTKSQPNKETQSAKPKQKPEETDLKADLQKFLNQQSGGISEEMVLHFLQIRGGSPSKKEKPNDSVKLAKKETPISSNDTLAAEFEAYDEYKHIKPIDDTCEVEECDITLYFSLFQDSQNQNVPVQVKSSQDFIDVLQDVCDKFNQLINQVNVKAGKKRLDQNDLLFPVEHFVKKYGDHYEIIKYELGD